MPFGNGRGPAGMGPMTGRGAGFCAGYPVPGYVNQTPGGRSCAYGFGHGFGRGHRNWYHATGLHRWQRGFPRMTGGMPFGWQDDDPRFAPQPSPRLTREDRIMDLEQHAQYLEGMLDDIRKQIESLKTASEAE